MKASTTARGYGHRHQQERKRWARLVESGQVACARCGWPIVRGEPWDLEHIDGSRYAGPEHRNAIGKRNGTASSDGCQLTGEVIRRLSSAGKSCD